MRKPRLRDTTVSKSSKCRGLSINVLFLPTQQIFQEANKEGAVDLSIPNVILMQTLHIFFLLHITQTLFVPSENTQLNKRGRRHTCHHLWFDSDIPLLSLRADILFFCPSVSPSHWLPFQTGLPSPCFLPFSRVQIQDQRKKTHLFSNPQKCPMCLALNPSPKIKIFSFESHR